MRNFKEVGKKKKIAVIIAILSVVVIGLVAVIVGTNTGLFDNSEDKLDKNDISQMVKVDNEIQNLINSDEFDTLDDNDKKAEQIMNLLYSLEKEGLIKKDSISYYEKSGQIGFYYSSGVSGGVYLYSFNNNQIGGVNDYSETNTEVISYNDTNTSDFESTNLTSDTLNSILTYGWDGIDEDNREYEAWENYVRKISKKGIVASIYDNPTILEYETMFLDNDLICIAEHGSFDDKTNLRCFAVNVEKNSKTAEEIYTDINMDIKNERVLRRTSTDKDEIYLITPKFFSHYYGNNQLKDAIVYIGFCSSFGSDSSTDYSFAEAFINDCGASSVVGFNNDVFTGYSLDILDEFTFRLLSGYTAMEALEFATQKCGNDHGNWAKSNEILDDYINNTEITIGEYISINPVAYPMMYGSANAKLDVIYSTITGTVKDKKTNSAIAGVKVEFIENENADVKNSETLEPVATATTDENGQFLIKLPYGSYSISFNHSDYEYYGTSLTVTNDTYEIEEKLTPKTKIIDSGTCGDNEIGDNLKWILYSNGELIIIGTGNMGNFEQHPWLENYRAIIKSVIVSNGVKSITGGAFDYCENLTTVSLPESITEIEDAFQGTAIKEFFIPANANITGNIFADCQNLKNIIVDTDNSYYKSIDGVLFTSDVTKLISYPAGKDIENYIIPNTVEILGDGCFKSCKIKEVTTEKSGNIVLPNRLTTIEYSAFADCAKLEKVILPNSVTSINMAAFSFCKNLKSITLSECLTEIEQNTFESCSNLTDIVIPETVLSIGSYAFYNCTSLKRITIKNMNCVPYTDEYTIPETAIICGYSFSSAQTYAEIYNRTFEPIDKSDEISLTQDIPNNVDQLVLQYLNERHDSTIGTLDISDTETIETDTHFIFTVRLQRNDAPEGASANVIYADVQVEKSTGEMFINNEFETNLW